MKLEFLDGTIVECRAIFGGPKLVNGVMRDTLRIEVDPDKITFDNLKKLFKDNPNTGTLNVINEENGHEVKNKLGDGYKVFVSISDEERKVDQEPGVLAPDVFEEIYVVTIAQQTYQESLLEQMNANPS